MFYFFLLGSYMNYVYDSVTTVSLTDVGHSRLGKPLPGPWISWSEWNSFAESVTLGRRGRGFDWNDTTNVKKPTKSLAHLSLSHYYSLHADSMVNPGDCFIFITNHIDIECKWWVHWGSKYHHFQCCYQCMWGGWRLGSCVTCHGKIVRRR